MTNAIILTTRRTGSAFLVECLQSHPHVHCFGEVLADGHIEAPAQDRPRYALESWRFIAARAWYGTLMMAKFFATHSKDVNAFKAMYNHINHPWNSRFLAVHAEVHVLHLRRHNLLRQCVSKLLLTVKREKRWQPHAAAPVSVARTSIDPTARAA